MTALDTICAGILYVVMVTGPIFVAVMIFAAVMERHEWLASRQKRFEPWQIWGMLK